ncbi:hypothetical protein [Klebsiella grimontii]|uniref:hypothetical protein n=1 Tax=Klebsiella grimontii TaxID=2058152 RepID=UPI001CCA305F|nr:hypothetical protein [Klebsiella grimontii]MBZ7661741.1 hypothetical protein [Klebsiella grimontii]
MKKRTWQRLILAAGVMLGNALLYSTPASAAFCNAFGTSGGACPTVDSVEARGGTATIRWSENLAAESFVSITGSNVTTWGLYMIYNWTSADTAGHFFSGGVRTPILTVTNSDPALKPDGTSGTDNCTSATLNCSHDRMAARFFNKYGMAGTATVPLPSSWNDLKPPCMLFGGIRPAYGDIVTVFVFRGIPPCQPGFPGTVEPEPDPDWCGMSTSALAFDFGDMSPATVSGQTMSKTAVMACSNTGISYNFYLSNVSTAGRDTIDLGRGITAKVTANRQALETKRTSTGATNTLDITVTLNGTPTSTGEISGTGILAVNYL